MAAKSLDYSDLRDKIKLFFTDAEEKDLPQTIPALAEFLMWRVDDLIGYPETGEYTKLITFAKLKCENWLMTQMLRGRIDKSTASLLFKMHFGYNEKNIKNEVKRSISSILDDIENS